MGPCFEAVSTFFQSKKGECFTSSGFASYIKSLMKRLTGKTVSVNGLRSAFLTWAYGQSQCDDAMKDSLALALRHSRQTAQKVYDRRTDKERKQRAIDLARRKAETADQEQDAELCSEGTADADKEREQRAIDLACRKAKTADQEQDAELCSEGTADADTEVEPGQFVASLEPERGTAQNSRDTAQKVYDRRTANERKQRAIDWRKAETADRVQDAELSSEGTADADTEVEPGQFVALLEPESTLQRPRILLGRVHFFLPDRQVQLLWYKALAPSLYGLEIDGRRWVESIHCLVPVTVKPAREKPSCFRLFTSPQEVYKAVHESARQT